MKTVMVLFVFSLVGCEMKNGDGPSKCSDVVAFPGSTPTTIRYEQLTRRAQDTGTRVMLQAGDAGHRLRVYPTTESDVWDTGGSITFVDASGDEIYSAADLCVAEFASKEWTIPDSAMAVDLEFPNDTIATILFTLVIES